MNHTNLYVSLFYWFGPCYTAIPSNNPSRDSYLPTTHYECVNVCSEVWMQMNDRKIVSCKTVHILNFHEQFSHGDV